MSLQDPPEHSVLPHAFRYRIEELHWSRCANEDTGGARIDLTLADHQTLERLRFEGVHNFEVDGPFTGDTAGLTILDQTTAQLDGLSVQVVDREASTGGVSFWARSVERVESFQDE